MVERCALSGSDLKIKFRTILLASITSFECIICRRFILCTVGRPGSSVGNLVTF